MPVKRTCSSISAAVASTPSGDTAEYDQASVTVVCHAGWPTSGVVGQIALQHVPAVSTTSFVQSGHRPRILSEVKPALVERNTAASATAKSG